MNFRLNKRRRRRKRVLHFAFLGYFNVRKSTRRRRRSIFPNAESPTVKTAEKSTRTEENDDGLKVKGERRENKETFGAKKARETTLGTSAPSRSGKERRRNKAKNKRDERKNVARPRFFARFARFVKLTFTATLKRLDAETRLTSAFEEVFQEVGGGVAGVRHASGLRFLFRFRGGRFGFGLFGRVR